MQDENRRLLPHSDRQNFEKSFANAFSAAMLTSMTVLLGGASTATAATAGGPAPAVRPKAYSVEMTNPPSLLPRTKIGEESALDRLSKAKILIIGHHNWYETDNLRVQTDTALEVTSL